MDFFGANTDHIYLVKLACDLKHEFLGPQMVVKSKGNGNPYLREIWVGEIVEFGQMYRF